MRDYVLVIDQGTTSTRAILFNKQAQPEGQVQEEFPQSYPREGWVEHSPLTIWNQVLRLSAQLMDNTGIGFNEIAGVGISNQRETTLVWDKLTGEPIYPAIVWQDRRTTPLCERWLREGHAAEVAARTGLLIDPYFSASKLSWILDNVPDARERAQAGELLF